MILDRMVRVETAVEIVAKKLWHRGDRATARDLFDFSLVIEKEPAELKLAKEFLLRHSDEFLSQIMSRASILRTQFEAIDVLNYRVSYDYAVDQARNFFQVINSK
jgi:hypothetical protein